MSILKVENSNVEIEKVKQEDLILLIKHRLRKRLYRIMSSRKSPYSTKEYCKEIDYEAIIKEIGEKPEGNYQIDHIVPLIEFNLNNIEEVKFAFHPFNLRWISAKENTKKKCNLIIPKAELVKKIIEKDQNYRNTPHYVLKMLEYKNDRYVICDCGAKIYGVSKEHAKKLLPAHKRSKRHKESMEIKQRRDSK